ncbi:M20/M25/M40 family metallo-hydrolase [Micromonospora sp. C28ISP2-4]|uniref:M20/M25/M40 family metallo-hydrolase n=1 Tax=Micromonospora sp. C28ISP2-4 TaxID=3059523 RepID=UPI0026745769|nr:M20/M25/M40 family metallo-hydrolase [Micromonospora sp. C28ISP2-4]MDO3685965.1 M20/M25/M40 family metallo-hydrolase [Micromonospora sp. C28ISP2-4]
MSSTSDVDLLEEMVRIPSPSGAEHRLSAFLAEAMTGLGLDAHVDEVGNVVGVTGTGDGPTVVLLSHLDTVPDPMTPRRESDRIIGRGAVDAKGPLAAMVMTAATSADFPGRLVVAGVVEEETPGSRGAMHVRATWPCPDAVVVGEPSGWQNVVIGYKGKLDLRYRVHRAATHPSNPVEKATEAAAAFWHDAIAAAGPEVSHAAFDLPGVTLVAMSGDTTDATLELSYRTPVGFDDAALLERLRAVSRGGGLELLNSVSAVRSDRRDPVVRALTAAIREVGGTPRPKLKTATSDMNTLAEVWPVPMATYGPGDSTLDHAADEHILIDDYRRGIEVLRLAVTDLGRRPPAAAVSPSAISPGGRS